MHLPRDPVWAAISCRRVVLNSSDRALCFTQVSEFMLHTGVHHAKGIDLFGRVLHPLLCFSLCIDCSSLSVAIHVVVFDGPFHLQHRLGNGQLQCNPDANCHLCIVIHQPK